MSLLRPFSASDLFDFNPINLDAFTGARRRARRRGARAHSPFVRTETYGVQYYLTYLTNWGDLFS